MSNCQPCAPCAPMTFCSPENFGLQFPSLIGPMGPPGGPGLFVENYNALRALDATVWPQGYMATVGGHTNAGDGGFGVFMYIPTSTEDDNDGTILEPTNSIGRWTRLYVGPLSVQWFGAVADGATDDSTAIQNAIDYIESLTEGGELYLPAGDYALESALAISGLVNLHFFGAGWGPTGTRLMPTGVINCLEMGSGSADRTVDLRIENLAIVGDDTDTTIGIVVNRLHDMLINRVKIQDFVVGGVDMNMAYNNRLNDVIITNCERGMIIDENNEFTRLENCVISFCGSIGIHFRNGSCSGSKIMHCRFEHNDIAIQVDAGTVEVANAFGVIGCYFKDQASENCLFGTDASAFALNSLLFQNNEIKAGLGSAAANNVTFDRCNKVTLIGNDFNTCDVITTVNVTNLIDLGNTYTSSAQPTEVQFGNPDGNLQAHVPTTDPTTTDQIWSDSQVMTLSV